MSDRFSGTLNLAHAVGAVPYMVIALASELLTAYAFACRVLTSIVEQFDEHFGINMLGPEIVYEGETGLPLASRIHDGSIL